jgi:hypothetical protein
MYAVSDKIYHKSIPSVSKLIKNYTNEGYFKEVKIEGERFVKYQSTPKPIVDIINAKTQLTDSEKIVLTRLLDSKDFRMFMGRNDKIEGMNTIIYLLSLMSVNALCLSQYLFYSRDKPFRERQTAMKDLVKIRRRQEAEQQILDIIRSKVQGYMKLFELPRYAEENQGSTNEEGIDINEKFILEFLTFNDELLRKIARSLNIYDILVESMAYAYETADFVSRKKGFR